MNKMGEWGILIVLLAGTAGGFLYWQKMATAPKRLPRARPTGGASGFQGGAGSPLSNPLRPEPVSAAPSAAPPPAASAAAMPAAAARMSASSAGQRSPAAAGPVAAPVAEAASVGQDSAASSMAGNAPPTTATSAAASGLFQPKSGRDPMQSVSDRNLILMYQRHQKDSKLLAEEMAEAARRRNHKPPPNPAAGISLEGIMTIDGRLSALINGNTLFVGSRIRGARIVAITPNSVTFSYRMSGGKTARFKKVMRQ